MHLEIKDLVANLEKAEGLARQPGTARDGELKRSPAVCGSNLI